MKKVPITATILAGGKGSRMQGQDKGLVMFQNRPLYQHVIERIAPQVDTIMINCNRNIEQYKLSGLPLFSDDLPGYLGPLAGIYSALLHSQTDWNLIVSCDTPFLPDDLVNRLIHAISKDPQKMAAYVYDGERYHPTILLIHKNACPKLKQFIDNKERKTVLFLQSIESIKVYFSDKKQCFININTIEQLHFLKIKILENKTE